MNHLASANPDHVSKLLETCPDADALLSEDVARLALLTGVFYSGSGPYSMADAQGETDVERLEALKLEQVSMYDEIFSLAHKVTSTHPKTRFGAFLKKCLVDEYESKFLYSDDDVFLSIKRSYEQDFARIDQMDLIATSMAVASSRRTGLLGWFSRAHSSGEA